MAKYNQKRAAELLGLTYHQLRALLKNIKCANNISTYHRHFYEAGVSAIHFADRT